MPKIEEIRQLSGEVMVTHEVIGLKISDIVDEIELVDFDCEMKKITTNVQEIIGRIDSELNDIQNLVEEIMNKQFQGICEQTELKILSCHTKPCFTKLLQFDVTRMREINTHLNEFGGSFRVLRNITHDNYILTNPDGRYRCILKDGDYIAIIFNPTFPTIVDGAKVFAEKQIDEYFVIEKGE